MTTPYYQAVSVYKAMVRSALQDMIVPYRYADTDIYTAFNMILAEVARIRPDVFLDLKYQKPIHQGDINDGAPDIYVSPTDDNTLVPIPSKYVNPIVWGVSGWLQLYDVTDTQDQRAAAFLQRFNTHFMSLTAA